MGRLELVVLGLTCYWALASAAKVSEDPAEGRGASLLSLSKIWNLDRAQWTEAAQGHWQEESA